MKTLVQKVRVDAEPHTETSLEYETTGAMGGDAGHGANSSLVLDLGPGAQVSINDEQITDDCANLRPMKLKIQVFGDWEVEGLQQVLQQLGQVLPRQSDLSLLEKH